MRFPFLSGEEPFRGGFLEGNENECARDVSDCVPVSVANLTSLLELVCEMDLRLVTDFEFDGSQLQREHHRKKCRRDLDHHRPPPPEAEDPPRELDREFDANHCHHQRDGGLCGKKSGLSCGGCGVGELPAWLDRCGSYNCGVGEERV